MRSWGPSLQVYIRVITICLGGNRHGNYGLMQSNKQSSGTWEALLPHSLHLNSLTLVLSLQLLQFFFTLPITWRNQISSMHTSYQTFSSLKQAYHLHILFWVVILMEGKIGGPSSDNAQRDLVHLMTYWDHRGQHLHITQSVINGTPIQRLTRCWPLEREVQGPVGSVPVGIDDRDAVHRHNEDPLSLGRK